MNWGRHGRHSIESAKDRFLSKTERREDGCLVWTGALNGSKRYGAVGVFGKQHLAHRASYMLFCGPIPDGMVVCHRCDVGLCVEPTHLFLGSQTDNIHDMERKGRSHHPSGADHGRAKLSWDDVDVIRQRLSEGVSMRELARQFSVARTTIKRIKNGTGWLPNDVVSLVVVPD